MLNQNQQQGTQQPSTQMQPHMQFGGHELLDADDSIGSLVGTLEHMVLYEPHVQDQELTTMMQRHRGFLTQLYNTLLDTMKTGKDPAVKTQTYNMQTGSNESVYGMKPSSPKTPIQSVNELNDECISDYLIGHLKTLSSDLTMAALEATNPVLRRVLADSVPNAIEMAYEMYLYMNKNGYYQVPQFQQQDMQTILNTYGPIQGNMSH